MDIKSEWSWIKAHERVLIVLIVLLAVCFLGNKWLNYDSAKKDAQYTALAQKLDEQKTVNEKQAQQTQAITAQYQEMVDALAKQNAALAGAISQRDSALKQKQQEIASMTLPQVAREWEKALNAPQGVLSVSGVSVVVAEPEARQTVSQLAKTTTLEANLTDQTQLTANAKAETAKANEVIGSQVIEIKGLNAQIVLGEQTCKAEVAKVKADGRRSKRNFFIAGFVAGIATRLFMKF
jgi:hypothetical protein